MMGLIHSATLRGRRQQFTLGYDGGSAAFTAGKTLTGATSHATAVIVSTGASPVSGTLTLHSITGTFIDNEAIADNGTIPGAAVVNGTVKDAFDINHERVFTEIDTILVCKLYRKAATLQAAGQAFLIESQTKIMFAAADGLRPYSGDRIVATEPGFEGTWALSDPQVFPGPRGIAHHWECVLAKGGA
jgi:hypothetical protein